jgi:hypothetical protein
MKTRVTLVLFLALAGRALAQDTNELLAAPQVRDFIVLQSIGDKLDYQIDGFQGEKFKPLPAGTASFVADRSINLLFHDFNPFVFSVTSTQSQSDDTSFASVQKFLEALAGLGKSIGIPKSEALSLARSERMPSELTTECTKTLQSSLEVSIWDQLTADLTATCRDDIYRSFCEAGDALYDNPGDESKPLKDQLKSWRKRSTSHAAIFTAEDAVQGEIQGEKETLDTKIETAAAKLAALEGKVQPAAEELDCEEIKDLTLATLSRFIRESNDVIAKKKRLSDSLKSLSDMLDKYKERSLWDDAGTSYRFASVEPSFEKIQIVAVTVNKRKFDDSKEPIEISDVKLSQSTLRIRHHSPFVPEVAAGVAASEIKIPKFGTAQKDGKTVVATAGSDNVRTIPALFFNGIIRFSGESFAYPMFQLGVGTGADRPSLLGGIGLRFTHPRHLALSLGYAVTWFKDLDKLKLGDEVKGTADVEADLKLRRSDAKPYISIQYSF